MLRKATLTHLILEKLAELGEASIAGFFPERYPEARLWRRLLGREGGYRFRKETFSTLLSRLQAEGLVARSGTRQRSVWRLTPEGEEHLRRYSHDLPRPDGVARLVAFDIPEKERAKRDAVRTELVAAGFTQLQKSVWYGERPLPPDFVELLDALQLKRHVHIFSIQKKGTLPPR